MISVFEAKQIIAKKITSKKGQNTKIEHSVGCVLTEDITAPLSLPPFRQSAMDGYAIHSKEDCSTYTQIAEIKAGDQEHPTLLPGQCVRIFTGAAVPVSADAVIMQEQTEVNHSEITINAPYKKGQNIREVGEHIQKDSLAVPKGKVINPATIGLLASLGIQEVQAIPKASIAILVTGDELVRPGSPISYGQIYESNSYMIKAALEEKGYTNADIITIKDDLDATIETLKELNQHYDVIIATGGISVGDYDFMGKALHKLDVQQHFYKIKQKPGKPMFFGELSNSYVFSLPGNPAAALVCFYEYIIPALSQLSAIIHIPQIRQLPLQNDFSFKPGRDQFLKSSIQHDEVKILEGQCSFMIKSFSESNAISFVSSDTPDLTVNDQIEVHPLEDSWQKSSHTS